MSIYGNWIAATIPAGGSSSSAIDLGSKYDYLPMNIPPLDSCKLYLQVAEVLAGPYYDLDKEGMEEESTFGRADVYRLGGWQYVKVVTSKRQSQQRLIRISGMRY